MKRPWQIWMLFAFSLALVLPAMVWLSVKAVELDRTEAEARRQTISARRLETEARRQAEAARGLADMARRQAELQERISNVLWRMDWTLTPLVAQEAARPHFVYEPFYPAFTASSGKTKGQTEIRQVPSPLLLQPSEYVRLHFQCTPDNELRSPQFPIGVACDEALQNGTTLENIRLSGERLLELQGEIDHQQLLSMLPERSLPPVEVKNIVMANSYTYNYNGDNLTPENPNVVNDLGLQQLEQFDEPQQEGLPQTIEPSAPAQQASSQPTQSPSRYASPNPSPQDGSTPNVAQQQATAQQSQPQGGGQRGVGQAPNTSRLSRQPPAAANLPDDSLTPRQIASVDGYLENIREQMKRAGREWEGRNRAYQSYAQSQLLQQRANNTKPALDTPQHLVSEGVTRPMWIGSKLILARRATVDGQTRIQGCWLDWPKIQQMLLAEVRQTIPEAELVPVTPASQVQPGRMLATLPVQLVVPEPTISAAIMQFDVISDEESDAAAPSWSAIRVSLVIAWTCLALATVAVAILLQGVMTLSERRGAFVAAVTHELRTPLTTFRMYAEMLSAGMVPSGEKRQQYLETLRVEADRLSHLVENVLAYARLERGKPGRRRETIKLSTLLERVETRLVDRASQAEMEFVVEADETARDLVVNTDPGAVEQILFNLVDNACKYAAAAKDRRIHLVLECTPGAARIRVRDHGPGIAPQEANKLFRPFSKSVVEAANSAPGVGLGLALCRRLASALGGTLTLENSDQGASFLLTLPSGK
ncbi:MAG: HAMP domain-containing sensor histidine kinase [Pirellulaceae bacterium]